MTGNQKFYMLRADNETVCFSVVEVETGATRPRWRALSPRDLVAGMYDESQTLEYRQFFLAGAALTRAEAVQRRFLERITARGTRNIRLNLFVVAEYIEETIAPGEARSRRLERKKGVIDMEFMKIIELFREVIPPIKIAMRFPELNPAAFTYTLTEEVIESVPDPACQSYLRKVKVGRLLTENQLGKLKDRLFEDFPDFMPQVIGDINLTASREHLSALSLGSKDGHSIVSIVNVQGQIVTMEDWKFLKLIGEHGKVYSLGQLDRRGGWLPEPLVKMNYNKVGEVIATYTADDSVLHVHCRQETSTGKGRIQVEVADRAEFVLDQDLLLCTYITLSQMRQESERFDRLRENAELKVAVNVDDLFDRDFFEDHLGDKR